MTLHGHSAKGLSIMTTCIAYTDHQALLAVKQQNTRVCFCFPSTRIFFVFILHRLKEGAETSLKLMDCRSKSQREEYFDSCLGSINVINAYMLLWKMKSRRSYYVYCIYFSIWGTPRNYCCISFWWGWSCLQNTNILHSIWFICLTCLASFGWTQVIWQKQRKHEKLLFYLCLTG